MSAQTIDGTAEEIPEQPGSGPEPEAPESTDLVPLAHAGAIIRAEDPDEIIAKAARIATSLGRLIEEQGLARDVGGRRKHVEVGGWQALGMLLGALGGQPLHAETVWTRLVCDADGKPIRRTYTAEVKRYHRRDKGGGLRETVTYQVDGHDWEARVEVRLPAGLVVGAAEAMCGRDEESWSQKADQAVRSMSETRAESRSYRRAVGWLVFLAGYSPTPAEEMPGGAHPNGADPVLASDELKRSVRDVVGWMLDHDDGALKSALKALGEHFGGKLPEAAGEAIVVVGRAIKDFRDAQAKLADDAAARPELEPEASEGAQGALPADRPPASSVPAPPLTGNAAGDIAALREAGCVCKTPLSDERSGRDDSCPISDHGIPF